MIWSVMIDVMSYEDMMFVHIDTLLQVPQVTGHRLKMCKIE